MEKFFIFMYRYWFVALFLGLIVSAMCFLVGISTIYLNFLPLALISTFYSVSMYVVRKRYRKTDEVRYLAHYLREGFYFLTLAIWAFWLAIFLSAFD